MLISGASNRGGGVPYHLRKSAPLRPPNFRSCPKPKTCRWRRTRKVRDLLKRLAQHHLAQENASTSSRRNDRIAHDRLLSIMYPAFRYAEHRRPEPSTMPRSTTTRGRPSSRRLKQRSRKNCAIPRLHRVEARLVSGQMANAAVSAPWWTTAIGRTGRANRRESGVMNHHLAKGGT